MPAPTEDGVQLHKTTEPTQKDKFEEAMREHAPDFDPEKFEAQLRKVVRSKPAR